VLHRRQRSLLGPDADVDRAGEDGRAVPRAASMDHALERLLDRCCLLLRQFELGEDLSRDRVAVHEPVPQLGPPCSSRSSKARVCRDGRKTLACARGTRARGARGSAHVERLHCLVPVADPAGVALCAWQGLARRVAKLARSDPIESMVEFEAGPAATIPGLRAVLRRHAPSATRQRTLEAHGIDCGAGPVSERSSYAASSTARVRLSGQDGSA
jgi:hypothetical protein